MHFLVLDRAAAAWTITETQEDAEKVAAEWIDATLEALAPDGWGKGSEDIGIYRLVKSAHEIDARVPAGD